MIVIVSTILNNASRSLGGPNDSGKRTARAPLAGSDCDRGGGIRLAVQRREPVDAVAGFRRAVQARIHTISGTMLRKRRSSGPDLPGPDDHRRRDRPGRAPLGDPGAQRQELSSPGRPPTQPVRTCREGRQGRCVVTAVRDPRTTSRAPRSLWICGQLLRSSPHTHRLNNNRRIQDLRPCSQSPANRQF